MTSAGGGGATGYAAGRVLHHDGHISSSRRRRTVSAAHSATVWGERHVKIDLAAHDRRRICGAGPHGRACRRAGSDPGTGDGGHVDGPAFPQSGVQHQHRHARLRSLDRAGRAAESAARTRLGVEGAERHDLGVQASPRRQVPRRIGFRRRGRGRLDQARQLGAQQPFVVQCLHPLDQGSDHRRSAYDALCDARAGAAAAGRSVVDRHRLAQARRNPDRRIQRRPGDDRHRAVQVRPLPSRRPRGIRAQ